MPVNSLAWSLAVNFSYYHHSHFLEITERPRSDNISIAITILAPMYCFLNIVSYQRTPELLRETANSKLGARNVPCAPGTLCLQIGQKYTGAHLKELPLTTFGTVRPSIVI